MLKWVYVGVKMKELINKLAENHKLSLQEWETLIGTEFPLEDLFEKADYVRREIYGNLVYIRGLIEISSYCKNDCYYCGIRCGNKNAQRYRLSKEQILDCCEAGNQLGFRTFVLQGGEDPFFTRERVTDIISEIKSRYPENAVTLSLGEKDYETYQEWFDAGADRYLLRHETADKEHYEKIHPPQMSFEHRIQCLRDLKTIGYQVGCGFMVESPYQTNLSLAQDMQFITEFQPEMVGIGPFISHQDTPFKEEKTGSLEKTLKLLALIRLAHPHVLLPATTALGTIHPQGRELGLKAGANVVMPNLSPKDVRKKYSLYDHKICTGEEAAECIRCLKLRVESAGYEIVEDRGDYK